MAVERQVSASTENQAKAAILYLYKQALEIELPWLGEVIEAKRPKPLPMVRMPSEVRLLLMHTNGVAGLIAQLLYGTGLWLMESLHLRAKDVAFARFLISFGEQRVLMTAPALVGIDLQPLGSPKETLIYLKPLGLSLSKPLYFQRMPFDPSTSSGLRANGFNLYFPQSDRLLVPLP